MTSPLGVGTLLPASSLCEISTKPGESVWRRGVFGIEDPDGRRSVSLRGFHCSDASFSPHEPEAQALDDGSDDSPSHAAETRWCRATGSRLTRSQFMEHCGPEWGFEWYSAEVVSENDVALGQGNRGSECQQETF